MTLTLRYVEATGPDQGERLGRYPLQDGDVVIADRGYNQPEAILRLREQAIHVVIRLNPWAMPLYQRTGERLDLVEHLQRVATEHHCLAVWLGKPGRACEAWVHAYRLAPAEAEAARRRCRRNAQGGAPSARTLFLAGWVLVLTTVPPHVLGTEMVMALYRLRWQVGVSEEGHIVQSVKVRPGPRDSSPVAWEAPWRESKTAKPSDNDLGQEVAQRIRLQRAVNAEVASLHAFPVAETVYNARRQQGPCRMSPIRRPSPAGYQRWHGAKEYVSTGETLGTRRRKPVEEARPITVSGKWVRRCQGDGSGCSTVDGRAAKRARREGPGPRGSTPCEARQG